MHKFRPDQKATRNAILADALHDTVAELQLIEAGDMIAYIRTSQWPNIADLVQSSAELSFAEGTLSFACAADFQVAWGNPASITLDMEFQASAVSAFFTLTLGASESLVDIKHVWFAAIPADEETGTRLLAQALSDARLPSSTATRASTNSDDRS